MASAMNPGLNARTALNTILRGDTAPFAPWVRYLLTLALCGVALAARFAMLPADAGLAFLTFYPVVIVAALVFGAGPGLLAIVVSAACADFFFLRPLQAFALGAREAL